MIYLDYNATTPLCETARAAMQPYLGEHFGNPSSIHAAGREARAAVDDARDRLAAHLRAKSGELVLTASGTEANNLAILGLARSRRERGRHLICSTAEHHAVLHPCEHLQKREGFEVTFLPVNRAGLVDPDRLASAIRPETILVSIMSANNETGVVQPLARISEICRTRGVLFHSDMVQSFAKQPTSLEFVDAASFAAHKFYGPKGAGLLFLRAGLSIESIQFGGSHENQRRPGTENVAAIAGMAAAATWAVSGLNEEQARQANLRDRLWEKIRRSFPAAQQNGSLEHRLANTLNVSFPGLSSETILMAFDLEGVGASSGSACMVGSVTASHVLLAMDAGEQVAGSAVRFSLGKQTTASEIESAGEIVGRVLERLGASRQKHDAYAVL
ncbi:MAG: cysteine desulfurase family protein [Chthoniobacterales bacterium]